MKRRALDGADYLKAMRLNIAATALTTGLLVGCSPALPAGQFGPYHRQSDHLILPTGDTLTVYRVKYWTFDSGEAPAIQLEYEPPFSVADTAAVHREARALWPYFVPYVEAQGLTGAIVTATNLHVRGLWPLAWRSHYDSFGFVAARGSDARWRFQNDSVPLPPADPSGIPRIIEPDGRPLSFDVTYPKPQSH